MLSPSLSNLTAREDAFRLLKPQIKSCLKLLPKRFVVDPLIQKFIFEINWIHDMIHPPDFFTRYEKWWRATSIESIEDIEFCVLFLRLSACSAQYVSAASFSAGTNDGSKKEPISELASRLSQLYESLPGPRSLTWVHQLFFEACYLRDAGRINEAWHAVGSALRVAQDLGMHLEPSKSDLLQVGELQQDLRKRAFWNLYLCDNFLSGILERIPTIHEEYITVGLPKLRLVSDTTDSEMPAPFDAQLCHIRITRLWSTMQQSAKANLNTYNPTVTDEQYETINEKFIRTLPPAFAIHNPSLKWDNRLPVIARQRLLLRIAILSVFCKLFKPLVSLKPDEIEAMPQYKQAILRNHRNRLVAAASSVLEDVVKLHDMMGKKTSRCFLLPLALFESAIILGFNQMSQESTESAIFRNNKADKDPLLVGTPTARRVYNNDFNISDQKHCIEQIKLAIERLQILSEVSKIARMGAKKLQGLVTKLEELTKKPRQNRNDFSARVETPTQRRESTASWFVLDTPQHMSFKPCDIMGDSNSFEEQNYSTVWAGDTELDPWDPESQPRQWQSHNHSHSADNSLGATLDRMIPYFAPSSHTSPTTTSQIPFSDWDSSFGSWDPWLSNNASESNLLETPLDHYPQSSTGSRDSEDQSNFISNVYSQMDWSAHR
jgi:hypothetical protein